MKKVCIDTGFLIALYDETDGYHATATATFVEYFASVTNELLVPWPILYETFSTKMVKSPRRVDALNRDWIRFRKERRLILLDDSPFRENAIADCFAETRRPPEGYRALSLVDRVIRNILADVNIKVDVLITLDYKDFVDVCRRYGRIMV